MDGYAERMIARGPTFEGDTATGSLHIVDLADAEAARAFAFEEPNFKAGVYEDVIIRRWRNLLGRTMWEFAGGSEGGPRFLVIAQRSGTPAALDGVDDFTARHRDRLIVYGALLSEDGSDSVGMALAVEAPSRDAVHALLETEPLARAGLLDRVDVHRWQFGGRR